MKKCVAWLLAAVCIPCLVASAATLSAKKTTELSDLISDLRTTGRDGATVDAAKALVEFPFLDVTEELIGRLKIETLKPMAKKMNTYVIDAILDTLATIGTSQVDRPLQALRTHLSDRIETEQNQQTKMVVLIKFDRTVATMKINRKTLKFSPLVPKPIRRGPIINTLRKLGFFRKGLASAQAAPVKGTNPAGTNADGTEAPSSGPKTLLELVKEADIPKDKKQKIEEFIAKLEKNLFDNSVQQLKDGSFTVYTGRDYEVRRMYQGLLRTQKAHLLITGEAGVGKTTLLEILSDAYVQGQLPFPGSAAPIILELSIMDVTNPADPSRIIDQVRTANELGKALNRHVILYVDEAQVASKLTRNAIKSFLTRVTGMNDNFVHLAWSTTSSESRELQSDAAFERRWIKIDVKGLSVQACVEAIKKTHLGIWLKKHYVREGQVNVTFSDINESAYEMAARYAPLEQPHASLIVGMKEILEGAMIHKLDTVTRELSGQADANLHQDLQLDGADIKDYLKFHLGRKLVPGDEAFEATFEDLWKEFNREASGNDGMKMEMKQALRSFLGSLYHQKMESWVIAGPPGGGKTHLVKKLAKVFFNGALLTLKGSELKNGGHEINKLIGSPPGTVGSEERRSLLTEFFAEHRWGIIFVDEADATHMDIYEYFTNMITDLKARDGLGKEWSVENYLLILATNVGQELMLPTNRKNRLTWEQYEIRKASITSKVQGVDVVRPEILEEVFEQFFAKIVRRSHPDEDGTIIAQESLKQMRRYQTFYMMTPDQHEAMAAAKNQLDEYVSRAKKEFEVDFNLAGVALDKLLEIEKYDFFLGYSYVENQLRKRLMRFLDPYLSRRGEKIDITYDPETMKLSLQPRTLPRADFSLVPYVARTANPWMMSANMQERIAHFENLMNDEVPGQTKQIHDMKGAIDLKLADWDRMIVVSQIGSNAGDQTSLGKGVARVLFGSEEAAYTIGGLHHVYDLGNYFRPPAGIQGGRDTTDFEQWFKSRQKAGGGVIIFEGLLNFRNLNEHALSERMNIFNKIHSLLSQGRLPIGNGTEDARGFVVVMTGDALSEPFDQVADTPYAQRQAERVAKMLTFEQIKSYFEQYHVTGTTFEDLGDIYVNPPPSREIAIQLVRVYAERTLKKMETNAEDAQISVDPHFYSALFDRIGGATTSMTNSYRAVSQVLFKPLQIILSSAPSGHRIELVKRGDSFVWLDHDKDVTHLIPDDQTLVAQVPRQKVILSEEDILHTAIHETDGHWMTGVLLSGENDSDAIVLAPSAGALAFVASKDTNGVIQPPSLTRWLKEVITLESGHRAVIVISGVYASGGGHADRDKKNPRDDLGRVDNIFRQILANQIFPDFTDYDAPGRTDLARKTFRRIGKFATDFVIRTGFKTGDFIPIREEVIRTGMVDRDRLDSFVKGLDMSKYPAPPRLLFLSFLDGVRQYYAANNGVLVRDQRDLIRDLLQALEHETTSLHPNILNDADRAEYTGILATLNERKSERRAMPPTAEPACDDLLEARRRQP